MNEQVFSSIDFVGQCLTDGERTKLFQKSIKQSVKKGDIVVDLGTGSGVMAIFASKQKAKKVFAVDFDSFVASIAQKNVDLNHSSECVSVLIEDVRNLALSSDTKINVVIAEMLTTGMVDEHQVQGINNLHERGYVSGKTTFIPERHDTFVSLVNADFNQYGLELPMTLHLWKWHNWESLKLKQLSNKVALSSIDFRQRNDDWFEKVVEIKITQSGMINAICLTSISILPGGIEISDTEALNGPMLIPLDRREAKEGEKIKLKIRYLFGGSYSNFSANIL